MGFFDMFQKTKADCDRELISLQKSLAEWQAELHANRTPQYKETCKQHIARIKGDIARVKIERRSAK